VGQSSIHAAVVGSTITRVSHDVMCPSFFWVLVKLNRDIHHVDGHCGKGFQGQRQNIKVIVKPNALWRLDGGIRFDDVASKFTC